MPSGATFRRRLPVIEHLRGRSTETKYGRIPLWLYETGVGLQAIATYGWLHGRYGHYDRVMPSYGTLARELGVSRGSVIAYVKQLVAVGAVQIETSGAVGQKTNEYVIAFNEPFTAASDAPVWGGQNADHLVSGLYRSGQPADQGGQPAVHEEDVSKKTEKTVPPSGPPNADAPVSEPRAGTDGGGVVELAMPAGGLAVLLEVARRRPGLTLSGRPLRDQALAVEGLLAVGWAPGDLAAALAGEPPVGMRSAGAVLAARIRSLPAVPPVLPRQGGTDTPPVPHSPAPPRPGLPVVLADPPPSCATCASYPAPGEDRCPSCLGWPLCASGCGRRTPDGAECEECVHALLEAALRAPETESSDCPGVEGPCGRPAVTLGWCSRCRIAVEAEAVRAGA